MLITQFDKFVNRSTQQILGSTIERENLVPMLSTDIPSKLQKLNVTENGIYYPETGYDGFYEVEVNVPARLEDITITENGTYTHSQNYDGLGTVIVNTKQGLDSPGFKNLSLEAKPNGNNLLVTLAKKNPASGSEPSYDSRFAPTISLNDFIAAAKSDSFYSCIVESYMTNSYISAFSAELIGDFHNGGSATNNLLTKPITDYSVIVLQGVYRQTISSSYNRSDFYGSIVLNTTYKSGMIDRNSSYDCGIVFTDSTHCNLSGNKQCMIYGIV